MRFRCVTLCQLWSASAWVVASGCAFQDPPPSGRFHADRPAPDAGLVEVGEDGGLAHTSPPQPQYSPAPPSTTTSLPTSASEGRAETGHALYRTQEGELHVVGATHANGRDSMVTGRSQWMLRLSAEGDELWRQQDEDESPVHAVAPTGEGGFQTAAMPTERSLWSAEGARLSSSQPCDGFPYDPELALAEDGSTTLLATVAGSAAPDPQPAGWCLARWDADGSLRWQIERVGPSEASALALDGSGGVFVAGRADLRWDSDHWAPGLGLLKSSGFLARLDARGQLLWERRWGREGTFALGVAADGRGGAIVTGSTFEVLVEGATPNGGTDTFVGRWDAAGNAVWMRQPGVVGWDDGRAVIVGSDDMLRVAGNGYDDAGAHVQYVQAFDLAGVASWRTEWRAGRGPGAAMLAAAPCGQDAVCATGWTYEEGRVPLTDAFVSRIGAGGELEWDRRYE